MSKPYEVHFQQYEGEVVVKTKFATLKAASKFVEDRWLGAEFMDSVIGFHNESKRYLLIGFTLKDIGIRTWHKQGYWTFKFNKTQSNESETP